MILVAQSAVQAVLTSERRELRRLTEEQFEEFYRRNGRAVMNYLARLCGDATLAEDLFQKTFYQLLRASVPVGDESQLRAYVFRIATNVTHDHWRKTKHESGDEVPEQADVRRDAEQVELRHDFGRTFAKLSPNERALLWFAHVEEMEHREVARHVGVKEKSVKVLLHRARRKLAAMLSQEKSS